MKPLRWYDHISINLFWLGLNIRNTALGSVFMPYLVALTVRPEIRNTALGAMRTAGLIVALLVQPAMGLLSDRSTSRFGRRRPFIVIGVVFDLLFLAAVRISRSYWALFGAGLVAGGVGGGLLALPAWAIAGRGAATALGCGVGGLVAMVVAVVVGVWGGALATLGQDARRNAPFTWWIVNRLLFLAAATSIQGFAPYFLMSAFGLN